MIEPSPRYFLARADALRKSIDAKSLNLLVLRRDLERDEDELIRVERELVKIGRELERLIS
jgi:hypothetical protein